MHYQLKTMLFLTYLILLVTTNSTGTVAAEQSSLTIKVHTASEASLHLNSTMIMGKKDMVLVDIPFINSDAHRLVADLLETGKNLTTVYVTHDHPDHFWAMRIVMDAFPNAKVVSHPQVVTDIWKSIPAKLERWSALLGGNGPSYPTAPQALTQDHLELEGHRINILGPMQGDHHHATALHIPDASTLIAGDITFQGIHVWLGETDVKARNQWIKNLDELARLEAKRVIAGHKIPGLIDDTSSLKFTRQYIVDFNREAKKAGNSKQLIAKMNELYPETRDVLNDFILPNSAKVGVGEQAPWKE